MDGGFCLVCVLFCHEFENGFKAKLLRTDPVRSSSSTVNDFKRHVEGKRKKKDHDNNVTLLHQMQIKKNLRISIKPAGLNE